MVAPPVATEGIGVMGYGFLGQGLVSGAAGRVREFTPLLSAMQALGEEGHPG